MVLQHVANVRGFVVLRSSSTASWWFFLVLVVAACQDVIDVMYVQHTTRGSVCNR